MKIIFFGSFQHYSALILESLVAHPDISVIGVITTPPTPSGRQKAPIKSSVHLLADQHHLPVLTPTSLPKKFAESEVFSAQPCLADRRADPRCTPGSRALQNLDSKTINKPDFFITAGYGKILPQSWLDYPTHGCLNLHFSLLPKFRGANPAEWAIMLGETSTGITLMRMDEGIDTGDIIAQASLPISDDDTRETLYQKLYELGAKKLPEWLSHLRGVTKTAQPTTSPTPYAALLKRQDGFLPWPTLNKALRGVSLQVEDFPSQHLQTAIRHLMQRDDLQSEHAQPNAFRQPSMRDCEPLIEKFLISLPRALSGYPSLWTIIPTSKGDKRMKILSFHPSPKTKHLSLNLVQIEGQQPALYNQIKNQLTN